MSLDFYRITRGLDLNSNIQILEGTGAPGASGDSSTAPVGSIYFDRSNGFAYYKFASGVGTNNWTRSGTINTAATEYGDTIINNGITNRYSSTYSFDDLTRTLTVTPVGSYFEFYSHGTRYTISSPVTTTIPNVEGSYMCYFDNTGTLVNATGTDDVDDPLNAYVAAIYWDATNAKSLSLGDERHGRDFPNSVHQYLHESFHTRWGNGFNPTNITADGSTSLDTSAQFGFTSGSIWDEDLEFTWTTGAPQTMTPYASIPIFYKIGADTGTIWRKTTANTFPVPYGLAGTNTLANFNEDVGGTFQISEATDGYFILMHYFATNNEYEPIIGVMGRAQYSTQADATTAADTELPTLLSFLTNDTPVQEYAPLCTVIFETNSTFTNTPLTRVRSLTTTGGAFRDWRGTTVSTVASSTSLTATWGSITGTLSSQTDLQSALNGKLSLSTFTAKGDLVAGTASATATNVTVGTDGKALLADSTQTSGLSWKPASTKRVTTVTSTPTPTPDVDTTDMYTITALAAAATFGAPTGTPVAGQPLLIRIKDNGTAQALAFNVAYRASSDLSLPTTTVINKTLYMGFLYNAIDAKWDMIALLNNF